MKSFVLLIGLVAIGTIVSAAPAPSSSGKLLIIIAIACKIGLMFGLALFNYAYMHDFCTVHACTYNYVRHYIIIHAVHACV